MIKFKINVFLKNLLFLTNKPIHYDYFYYCLCEYFDLIEIDLQNSDFVVNKFIHSTNSLNVSKKVKCSECISNSQILYKIQQLPKELKERMNVFQKYTSIIIDHQLFNNNNQITPREISKPIINCVIKRLRVKSKSRRLKYFGCDLLIFCDSKSKLTLVNPYKLKINLDSCFKIYN